MNEYDNDNQDRIARRNFLKATSSATAFGLVGVSSVDAQPGEIIGKRAVAKAELELPVLPDLSESGLYPVDHLDNPQDHLIHEGRLYLLESSSEDDMRAARRSSAIVRNGQFHPMDRSLFGLTVQSIPTDLGWAMQRSHVLKATDGYEAPPVTLHPAKDGLKIDGPSVTGEVPVDAERRFELPAQKVELSIERPTDEKIDRPDIPERLRGVKIERWTETVTIEPELVVRNHGQLEVVDATDQVTISRE